ncbi:hypothetical protein CSKR_202358, partial [Clonorchis sinensis]
MQPARTANSVPSEAVSQNGLLSDDRQTLTDPKRSDLLNEAAMSEFLVQMVTFFVEHSLFTDVEPFSTGRHRMCGITFVLPE